MKKNRSLIITLALATLSLTGCATAQQAQIDTAAQKAQVEIANKCSFFLSVPEKEAMAWINFKPNHCLKGLSEPIPREHTMEVYECVTKAYDEEIRPKVHSEKRFNEYMEARKTSNIQYAEGDISLEKYDELSNERWLKYFGEAKSGSYFNYAQCQNAVFNDKLMPVYPNQLKPILIQFMTDLSSFSREADKKKIASEDYQVGYQKLWSEFASKEQQRISQANAQNAAAWQQWSRNMQQYSVEMQKASQPTSNTSSHSIGPTRTDCYAIGNTMSCTSN